MITDKDFEIAASDVAAAPVVRRAVKSVKITVGLNPYSDGSGHQQTVTVVRSESGKRRVVSRLI